MKEMMLWYEKSAERWEESLPIGNGSLGAMILGGAEEEILGLNEENEICKIMEYRSVDLSKIKNKAEKERFARLKRRYALPDTRTAEQKQMDIGAILGGMIR